MLDCIKELVRGLGLVLLTITLTREEITLRDANIFSSKHYTVRKGRIT